MESILCIKVGEHIFFCGINTNYHHKKNMVKKYYTAGVKYIQKDHHFIRSECISIMHEKSFTNFCLKLFNVYACPSLLKDIFGYEKRNENWIMVSLCW